MFQIKFYLLIFLVTFCLIIFIFFLYLVLYFYVFKRIYYYLVIINKKQKSSPFLTLIINLNKKEFKIKENYYIEKKIFYWKHFFISFYCDEIFKISIHLQKICKKKFWNIFNFFKLIYLYFYILNCYRRYHAFENDILENLNLKQTLNNFYILHFFYFQKIEQIYFLYFQDIKKLNIQNLSINKDLQKIILLYNLDLKNLDKNNIFFLNYANIFKKMDISTIKCQVYNNFIRFLDLHIYISDFFEFTLNPKFLKIKRILNHFQKEIFSSKKNIKSEFQDLINSFNNFQKNELREVKINIFRLLYQYQFVKVINEFNQLKSFLNNWLNNIFFEISKKICVYFFNKTLHLWKKYIFCYQKNLKYSLTFNRDVLKNNIFHKRIADIIINFKKMIFKYNNFFIIGWKTSCQSQTKTMCSSLITILDLIKNETNNILFINSIFFKFKKENSFFQSNYQNFLNFRKLNNALILLSHIKKFKLKNYFWKKFMLNFYYCFHYMNCDLINSNSIQKNKYLYANNNLQTLLKKFQDCLIFFNVLNFILEYQPNFVFKKAGNEKVWELAAKHYQKGNFAMFLKVITSIF